MSPEAAFFGIVVAILVGAVSPGPSFVLVSRISVTASRTDGLMAALGMGFGGALFASLALAGVTTLLLQVGWLYLVLKICGGAYLVYLAMRIWRGAAQPLDIAGDQSGVRRSPLRSLGLAFLTQLSNPKTAVVYASIFAALLPASPPWALIGLLPPAIFVVEAGWYAVVALAFSATGPRRIYIGFKAWIDRLAGAVMGALGIRLILESLPARTS